MLAIGILAARADLEYELALPTCDKQKSAKTICGPPRESLDPYEEEVLLLIETDSECLRSAERDLNKWAGGGNPTVATCAYPAAFGFKIFALAAGLRAACQAAEAAECQPVHTLETVRSTWGDFQVKMHELAPNMRLPLEVASTIRRFVLEESELMTRLLRRHWTTEALEQWLRAPLDLAASLLALAQRIGERRRVLLWRSNMMLSVVEFGLGHLAHLVAPRSDFLLTRHGALEELLGGPPADGLTLVEVGVHLARLAVSLLGRHSGLRYLGVDPFEYGSSTSTESRERQLMDLGLSPTGGAAELSSEVREAAEYKLGLFAGRAKLLAMPSVEAAATLPDRSVDGVFIDGDHSYMEVLRDIDAWEPKVKLGGFLSGHDFGNHPDVARAVLERADEFNRTVHLSMDWFWYVYL